MKTYHRGKGDQPRECVAQPGNCPLGGHGSLEYTNAYCDKINHAKYSLNEKELIEKAMDDSAEADIYRTALREVMGDHKKPRPFKMSDFKFNDFTEADSGISWNPLKNETYETGFSVSLSEDVSEEISETLTDKQFQDRLKEYCEKHQDLLSKPNHCLGLWRQEGGSLWLDISEIRQDATDCRKLGSEHDQIAYFDMQTYKSVLINADATSGQQSYDYESYEILKNEVGHCNRFLDNADRFAKEKKKSKALGQLEMAVGAYESSKVYNEKLKKESEGKLNDEQKKLVKDSEELYDRILEIRKSIKMN